jgi:hypothetical protein
MPSTLVHFRMTSAFISMARSAAAVSVVESGLPLPAATPTAAIRSVRLMSTPDAMSVATNSRYPPNCDIQSPIGCVRFTSIRAIRSHATNVRSGEEHAGLSQSATTLMAALPRDLLQRYPPSTALL